MSRVDRILVGRLAASVGLTFLVLYGIVAVAGALDVKHLGALAARGGIGLAGLAIANSAARTVLSGFTVVVLLGVGLGLLSLQASRELTVIKASGLSVWRLLRIPAALCVALGLVLAVVVDTGIERIDRDVLSGSAEEQPLWLAGGSGDVRYVLEATGVATDGSRLSGVTIFLEDSARTRIEADAAVLETGHWRLPAATLLQANASPRQVTDYLVPTRQTAAAVRARLQAINRLTVFELASALASGAGDQALRDSMLTRMLAKIALPLSLVGSLLIAFAFTGGYRKTNNYGGAVLYGVVLGFVVYVVTEMAFRAGDAGLIAPAIAAFGPSFVAIVVGSTILLFREDGRTR
jgi:lipopolysaccharide export system permease protein